MKKVICLLFLTLFLIAQDGAAAANERLRVAFVNPGKTGEVFWDLVSQTMRAAARQLNIDVEILYAERNHRSCASTAWRSSDALRRPTI